MPLRLALTCNGPGEFAGWVRPLAAAFARLAPEVELHCFFVPDDYATGREVVVALETSPGLRVHSPRAYLNFAVGAKSGLANFDGVLYLGGDVLHAVRIHSRLGGAFFAYRFAPRHIRSRVQHAFALDEKNATQMRRTLAADRVEVIGNLAVDGAFAQVEGVAVNDGQVSSGVMFMPGSRRHEITNLFPFFASAAAVLQPLLPNEPIVFGLSPFVELSDVAAALEKPPDRHLYAQAGRLITHNGQPHILMPNAAPFPIVRTALASALSTRLVVTIPGTKSIELTALGVPHLVCTPFNIPERVVINGPLTYLDRLPILGAPLKRAAVMAFANRFAFYAQTNIDLGYELVPELQGTLTPGRVADKAATLALDAPWQATIRPQLAAVYRAHRGATERMVCGILRECGVA